MLDALPAARHRFWLVNYLLILGLVLSMTAPSFVTPAWPFALAASMGYALLYSLPLWLFAWLLGKLPGGRKLASVWAVVSATLLLFLLYADKVVFGMYGFHFNGFVWNLVTTPGGIAALEGSRSTYVAVAVIFVLMLLVEVLLFWGLWRFASPLKTTMPNWMKWGLVLIVLGMVGERVTFGISHFFSYRPVLTAAQEVPFYQQTTFARSLQQWGFKAVRSHELKVSEKGRLDYPLHPIRLAANAPRPNIVWLVCESLRADMLTPEIMPNLWRFSEQNLRFENHISGGAGTRWGVFSLFYGLPANYWFSMLDARQPPVLITTLQKQGYRFGLYSSAKFTYPEFDKTVWASVPATELHEHITDLGWKSDRINVQRLEDFMDTAQAARQPFMGFLFFESSHARYFFPDEAIIRPDYLKDFNYATADIKKDIELIRNRYINATHGLDQQLGRVLDHLRKRGLLDNTIVIVTGDHGEEFMEKGRWGHNSAFTHEQIATPMVVHVPGQPARVVHEPTSHLDLVPTLMPLLGVKNPASDYSVDGVSLLAPTRDRFRVLGAWGALGYVSEQHKIAMPTGLGGIGYLQVSTVDDQPLTDEAAVMQAEQPGLVQLLKDVSVFYHKR